MIKKFSDLTDHRFELRMFMFWQKKFGPFLKKKSSPSFNRVKGENVKIVSIYVIIEIFLQEHALKYFKQKVDFEKIIVPFKDVGYREKSSFGTIFRHDKNRLIIPPVLRNTVLITLLKS